MMAILNRNQELPRDRAELYNQSSRVLLHQWDTERALQDARLDPISLDYKDKQAMLRRVAYFMQEKSRGLAGNSIVSGDLEGILKDYLLTLSTLQGNDPAQIARVLIEQLRSRNFILCYLGGDYYAFVHRTFLEYFSAWEFVWKFEKEQVIDLEYLKTEVFGKKLLDESWHEVLLLIAGMLDAKFVGEIVDYLIERRDDKGHFTNLSLAAKCLSEVRNRTAIAPISMKLFGRFTSLVDRDLNPKELGEIMAAIARIWKKDEKTDTLSWVKKTARDHPNSTVRIAAIGELVNSWQDDRDTLPFLESRIKSDPELLVRSFAQEKVFESWIASFIQDEDLEQFHQLMKQQGRFKVLILTGPPKIIKSYLLKKVFPDIFQKDYDKKLYVYIYFDSKKKIDNVVRYYLDPIATELGDKNEPFLNYNKAVAEMGSKQSRANRESEGINWYANDHLVSEFIEDIRGINNRILLLFDAVDELELNARMWLLERLVPGLLQLENVSLVLAGRTLEEDCTSKYEEFCLKQHLSQISNFRESIRYLEHADLSEDDINLCLVAANYDSSLFMQLVNNLFSSERGQPE